MTQIQRFASRLAFGASALAFITTTASAGEITWWTPNFNEARARELLTRFQTEHPDVTVNLEITTTNGLPERILTTLQSGAAPDLIDVQHPWVNNYAQNGLVIPLDDVLEAREDYNEAALDYVTWDDQLWGIPYRIEAIAVLYNRGHFAAAGLDPDSPPKTWDELLTTARTLTEAGHSGFAITGGGEVGNTIFRSLPFVWMNGGDLLSEDGTTAVINSPEAVEAVKFWTDMYVEHGVSPTSTLENDGTANRRLFIADQVSMYQSGQFDIASIQTENPNIDIGAMMTPHPEGGEPAAILGGWSWVVPTTAENPEDAKTLIRWLAQPENMGFFTDTFPARTSAMELPRFDDPMLQVFGEMLPYGRPLPTHPQYAQMAQAYFDGIQRILIGEQTAQEAMDLAAEDIQALLDQ
ncbi:ABC transporter substrate-binding protein [Rubellimicrobium rubrum]|uniref:ABC transporter substrate-binding protein n=1 Tax=Rubellimicrobium rubrum TaxID=2585369 RepID=A0A5C4N3R7_9RHOB|nr:ABC transporter substrate-binding protein [Rubellimicrobium rubrum]TNC51635.1 ABC transporter substrate-binding protein [Rubellimicrobium rubrum]